MSLVEAQVINGVDELRRLAPEWDQLWCASAVTGPAAQAEHVALWHEAFGVGRRLRAFIVRRGGKLIAALPLVNGRVAGLVPAGTVPGNAWSAAGELLLHPEHLDEAAEALAAAIARCRWPLVEIPSAETTAPHWQAMLAALERAGCTIASSPRFQVGRVAIESDWPAYMAGLSRNHRRQMRVAAKRAVETGTLELVVLDKLTPDEEVETPLRSGFAVEDRSWKAREGSSVLRSPGVFEFYVSQARQLAARGQLCLVLLELDGQPIGFEYAWFAKGVYHPLKVGYDESQSHLTPGQLLRWRLIERFHADNSVRMIDFLGPLVDATDKWTTETYQTHKLLIAPRRWSGRLALAGYRLRRRFMPKPVARATRPAEPCATADSTLAANAIR